MTQKILEAEGEGDPEQLDFFLKGNLALEKNARRKPHSWLPDQVCCTASRNRHCCRQQLFPLGIAYASIQPIKNMLAGCKINFDHTSQDDAVQHLSPVHFHCSQLLCLFFTMFVAHILHSRTAVCLAHIVSALSCCTLVL